MTTPRWIVRSTISLLCVAVGVVMIPPVVVFKVFEGIYFCVRVSKDCVKQVWAARGAPGLDD